MTGQQTAKPMRVTEHQKARARLILLSLIGVTCPPLAGVRSVAVWILYAAFLIAYSLWALRLTRSFSTDRRLGYLLTLTDTAVLLPLMAWASTRSIQIILAMIAVAGLVATCWAGRGRSMVTAYENPRDVETGPSVKRSTGAGMETALERAVRVRLRVLAETQTRFALVVLRVIRLEEIGTYYGAEAADHVMTAVSRRGLRVLGADAQHFFLPGGRVAFVFSTGSGSTRAAGVPSGSTGEHIDPYDVEGFAMALGRKACEHLVDGRRVECVVGWASAPADGLSADDLMYAAESGAQSTAAFRRVAGSRVPVPEKTRAVAG
ncbi:MAG: hypothetical protein JW990_16820 [Thermoleophilia bacterium]|nr:hypothetical protein [Thermoleophilia bacterium]